MKYGLRDWQINEKDIQRYNVFFIRHSVSWLIILFYQIRLGKWCVALHNTAETQSGEHS